MIFNELTFTTPKLCRKNSSSTFYDNEPMYSSQQKLSTLLDEAIQE